MLKHTKYLLVINRIKPRSFSHLSAPVVDRTKLGNFNDLQQKRHLSVEDFQLKFIRDGVQYVAESEMTSYFAQTFTQVHEITGLPWWCVIVGSSILLRSLLTFPAQIFSQRVAARRTEAFMEMDQDKIPKLRAIVSAAARRDNLTEKQTIDLFHRERILLEKKMIIKHNCARQKLYLPQYLQIPIWLSTTIAWRSLYTNPEHYRDFASQGIPLLMPDLTAPLETWFVPILNGLIYWGTTKIHVLVNVKDDTVKLNKIGKFTVYFTNAMILLMVFITSRIETGLALYWTTSAAMGLVSNLVLLSPKLKRACNIRQFEWETAHPYRDLYANILRRIYGK